MIKVTNLNKYYKAGSESLHVINDTTLDLPDKGLVTLLGESGSGKTTLLNVIGGLDKAQSGTLDYGEAKFTKYNMGSVDKYRRENIGYIFQKYNLLTNKTVQENLALSLDLIGITDKEEVKKRCEYALKAVGLFKFRKKLAGQLSGGQQQRVAIARALVKKNNVLIADEPTGNLDSTNSIEVMNILKKISETTLVLLVTHDRQLAEFYSNKILEISDGKITNIREPKGGTTLNSKKDNTLYLKDMNKKEVDGELSLVAYSNGEIPDINLTLVEVNGTYYIKSNVKLKMLEDSNIKIVDDHYKEETIEKVSEEITYDTSWYNDTRKREPFKRLGTYFGRGFKDFFKSNKKQKFLRLVLVVIGLIMSVMVLEFCQYSYFDKSGIIEDQSVYYIKHSTDNYNLSKALASAYSVNKESVNYISASDNGYTQYEFEISKSFYDYREASFLGYNVDYTALEGYDYVVGGAPQKRGDVVLGLEVADKIKKKFGITYEEILTSIDGTANVTGITKKKTKDFYVDLSKSYSTSGGWYSSSVPQYYFMNYKDFAEPSSIIYGNYFEDADSDSVCITMPSQYYESLRKNMEAEEIVNNFLGIYEDFQFSLLTFSNNLKPYNKIRFVARNGHFIIEGCDTKESSEYSVINEYSISGIAVINANLHYSSLSTYVAFNKLESLKENAKLVNDIYYPTTSYTTTAYRDTGVNYCDGNSPKEINEIALPINSGYSVGDTVTYRARNYVVSGLYYYSASELFNGNYSRPTAFMHYLHSGIVGAEENYEYYDYYIQSNDFDTLKKELDKYDIKISQLRDVQINEIKNVNKENRIAIYIIILVLFSISVIYIYFTMRSKMISDIYEIGVLRNIGASRSGIISKYIVEITINTMFTTLIGYIVGIVISGVIVEKLKQISGIGFSVFSTPYPYLGLLLVFGVNLIFGLIPILGLLRKTPSEISSKYDI